VSIRLRIWLYGPPFAYCTFIFFLSNEPQLPSTPGGDLLAHFCAYTVMGVLFFRALALSRSWARTKVWAVAALAAALYGVSDEFHQSFIPGRFATVEDALADAAGAVFGAAFALLLYKRSQDGTWSIRFRT